MIVARHEKGKTTCTDKLQDCVTEDNIFGVRCSVFIEDALDCLV
jgi:hypothetical protein